MEKIRSRVQRRAHGEYRTFEHVRPGICFLQHDYDLANQAGAAFRSDNNSVLGAIVSLNSGATAPTTTFAYMLWADTANSLLKQRNAANTLWLVRGSLKEGFVQAKVGTFNIGISDFGQVFNCSGTFTVTLTAVATLADGFFCCIRNNGTGVITLDPNGAETVDGVTTLALGPGESCFIWCDGSKLITVGRASGLTNPAQTTQALLDTSSPVAWDANLGHIATWALNTGSPSTTTPTLALPTNLKVGGRYVLIVTQPAAGGVQITWTSGYKNGSGTLSMPQPSQQGSEATVFTFTSPEGASLKLESREAMVLLATATGSASASIDFTNLVGFSSFHFVFHGLRPATNLSTLLAQFSTDNGATWVGAGYFWELQDSDSGGTAGSAGSLSDTTMTLDGSTSSSASNGICGFAQTSDFSQSGKTQMISAMLGRYNGTNMVSSRSSGQYPGALAVNGVRFKFSSGNIADGTIKCYGLRG